MVDVIVVVCCLCVFEDDYDFVKVYDDGVLGEVLLLVFVDLCEFWYIVFD